MLDETLIERALRWLAAQHGEPHVMDARRAFEEITGPILEGASDYESRIAHFFEQHLCEANAPDQEANIAAFARASADLSPSARRELAGWLRSHRSLFVFEAWAGEQGRVRDLLLGGVFHFLPQGADRQLTPGDRFDGRIVPVENDLWLSPGRVFHPREAHASMDALLAEARSRALEPRAMLDGLLRMRARFRQFESIRAEHVYRLDALEGPAFAAPWAKPGRR